MKFEDGPRIIVQPADDAQVVQGVLDAVLSQEVSEVLHVRQAPRVPDQLLGLREDFRAPIELHQLKQRLSHLSHARGVQLTGQIL